MKQNRLSYVDHDQTNDMLKAHRRKFQGEFIFPGEIHNREKREELTRRNDGNIFREL